MGAGREIGPVLGGMHLLLGENLDKKVGLGNYSTGIVASLTEQRTVIGAPNVLTA